MLKYTPGDVKPELESIEPPEPEASGAASDSKPTIVPGQDDDDGFVLFGDVGRVPPAPQQQARKAGEQLPEGQEQVSHRQPLAQLVQGQGLPPSLTVAQLQAALKIAKGRENAQAKAQAKAQVSAIQPPPPPPPCPPLPPLARIAGGCGARGGEAKGQGSQSASVCYPTATRSPTVPTPSPIGPHRRRLRSARR